ncbi:MAG: VTT domain-containing protein [Dehalococcoidia bacterium]|nr:VTT domain-containing protein [Dehalococcoidia bacterium]
MSDFLSSISHRISQLGEISGVRRRLLLAAIVILVVVLCYAIFRLSPYLEGFERYGYLGAFLVAFIASTTVIFPIPGFIVIWAMAASPAFSWAWVALAAAIGGGLGEFTAYLAGYVGAAVVTPEQSGWYQRAENWMRRYGGVTIFLLALVPVIPFDLAGIAAGTLRFPFWKFLLATLAGRLPRTFIECYLVYLGWKRLPTLGAFLGELTWWSWVIIGVCIAVIIGSIIMIRRRKRADRK